jgi:hypothetical protein
VAGSVVRRVAVADADRYRRYFAVVDGVTASPLPPSTRRVRLGATIRSAAASP